MMRSENNVQANVFNNILPQLIIFLPCIIYIAFVFKYSLNLPRADDFYAILEYLSHFKNADFRHKLALLFSQHNEHRIFSSRLFYTVYYLVTGTINFQVILYANAAILIGIYLFLVSFLKKCTRDLFLVFSLFFGLCLFDLNNFENALFAMTGMQNYGVILIFLASLYCYSKDGAKFLATAATLHAVCIFSSGNGILGSFFLFAYCFMTKNRPKMIVSFLVMAICTALYYYDYTHIEAGSSSFTKDASKFVPYFLQAMGVHFSYTYGVIAGILVTASLVVFIPWEGKLRIKEGYLPFLAITGFLVASTFVMAVFRGNLPVEFASSSRYRIYSNMLVPIGVLFLFSRVKFAKIRAIQVAGFVLLVTYCINFLEGKNDFEVFYNMLKGEEYGYPDKEAAKRICDDVCQQKIYCIKEVHAKIK